MKILLDTHVYLWVILNDRCLSKKARTIIENANEIYVSSVSIWEASIKIRLGKLQANINELVEAITESGFLELSVTVNHAASTFDLPNLHRDPFDRVLIAQAISEPLQFLTSDKMLQRYSSLVKII